MRGMGRGRGRGRGQGRGRGRGGRFNRMEVKSEVFEGCRKRPLDTEPCEQPEVRSFYSIEEQEALRHS